MLKKVGIAMGAIFAVIVLAGLVFYVGWVRAPSQEAVCENMIAITKKDQNIQGELPAPVREQVQAQCMKMTKKGKYAGLLPYAKKMKCLESAESMEGAKACLKKS